MSHPGRRWALAALVASVLGVLAGCGSSGSLPMPATTATPASHSATTSASASTTAPLATTTEVTATVTLPGYGRPPVLLGDENTPEQFILGTLYLEALSAQGFQVQLDRNIGTSAVAQAALAEGSLDLYPVSVSDYLTEVAHDPRAYPNLTTALDAARAWAGAHGQTLLDPTPFADTAGVAVLGSYAAAHRLRSLASLRRVARRIAFGAPLEFTLDSAGFGALEHHYRVVPGLTSVVNLGTQYNALYEGLIQAAYVRTTDPALASPRYRALADPRHAFGFGNVVPVVSAQTIAAEGPAFVATIERVDRLLTQQAMRGLTGELSGAANPAAGSGQVANDFLEGNGLLPPPPWSTLTSTTAVPTLTEAVTTVTVP